ncbi:hypothetical protein PsorP6_015447 [Peronosclerospora sorghi]|uniref:Uncharacterized protein n=1 Tax=Peronosclerospora sorghi TaxID=230839 RepID=A0ACC0WP32_9STRA|nr:hypothetical protein PsorP6_015447 [Peronosclerospora sorghi]
MIWSPLAVVSMALSSLATGMTMISMRRSWDLQVSSVRWLFFYFFVYLWLWSSTRVLYLLWVRIYPIQTTTSDDAPEEKIVYDRYSSMGIYTVLQLEETHDVFATTLLCFGDATLFAVALWMFPLTFELSNIAAKSMDRGAEKEKRQIKFYAWTVHGLVVIYAGIETAFAIAYHGYTQYTQWCLVSVYFVQFTSFLYMIWLIVRLKVRGRKYENVQGQFVTSPVYQRLKRIMIVYALFSLQFQLASVVMYASAAREKELLDFISVSLIIYYLSGMALAVTTMCSQACVLNVCRPCLPDHIEAQVHTRFLQGGDLLSPRDTQILIESAEPPLVNPVFVFTDIESSSALWAIGDGLVMQRATEIHDNILRASLMKYRGYEITTAGDAFQLAFHTVREAVEYCLDVQLQLLVANWPKELHGMLPATRRQRLGHRLIFGGLRVRMGIHDAVDADGALILDVHAVTGKMIYTGASEVIANEIGDLGDGGQILVTKRVADWLVMYEDLVAIDFLVERVGEYAIPQIKAKLEVYQVLPEVLSGRKKMFSSTLKKRRATTASSLYSIASSNRSRLSSNGGPLPLPEPRRRLSRPQALLPPRDLAPVQGGLSRFGRVQRSFLRPLNRILYQRPRKNLSVFPVSPVNLVATLSRSMAQTVTLIQKSPKHPPPSSAGHTMVVWTALAIASMGLSSVATGITSCSLYKSWDLKVSSVRWLFFIFFASYSLYTAARVAYMITVSVKTRGESDLYMAEQLTTFGVFAPVHSRMSHDLLVTLFLVVGDSIHFSVAIWTFPLIYELGLIANKTMDRGVQKEQEQIYWYRWYISPVILGFSSAETFIAVYQGGYTGLTQAFQVVVYITMFMSFLYMLNVVLKLKRGGRKYENVQGHFITSPVYQRLSRILMIYAIFTFQYQLASILSFSLSRDPHVISDYTSISTVIYNTSGLALAITTMCSQVCILQLCRCCMPEDIEAHFEANLMRPGLTSQPPQILFESADPPFVNPVFVFTDIQQSSALWAVGDGLIMQQATEIHDNILRSALMRYRGYEITTAGDAFQLAFHTIREAVEYCLYVQLQLLHAAWPRELHGLLPATKKERSGRRLIFRGLRVRMGIHDATDADGTLVVDVHAVTGKVIYTGASEVIANEIGDLGDGGQILITSRVADWIKMYSDLVGIPCFVDRVGEFPIPQIKTSVQVFQLVPTEVAKRTKQFAPIDTTTLKRRPTHGNSTNGALSFYMMDNNTPPGLSVLAAERRRTVYEHRERYRQLDQGAHGHSTIQSLALTEEMRPKVLFVTRSSVSRTSSM